MKIYFVGHKKGRILLSYFYTKTLSNINKEVELFLDSGAFSAWSQGKTINISDYINFIKEHIEVIDVYANLDVIGDARATWCNQLTMEKVGLKPLPVFHYGEDEKWLNRYIKREYEIIGLGGMVPISTDLLKHWLDRLFKKYLTDSKGIPTVKIHGFGLTSLPLLIRYPWYSVDSTSWTLTGGMGFIYIPRWKGEWIYNENAWKIAVSSRNPSKKDGEHIDNLSPKKKQIFLNYIHEKGYQLGKSEFRNVNQDYKLAENEQWFDKKPKSKHEKRKLEIIIEPGVSNKYQLRDELNTIYFLDLEKSIPEWPWPFKKKGGQYGLL